MAANATVQLTFDPNERSMRVVAKKYDDFIKSLQDKGKVNIVAYLQENYDEAVTKGIESKYIDKISGLGNFIYKNKTGILEDETMGLEEKIYKIIDYGKKMETLSSIPQRDLANMSTFTGKQLDEAITKYEKVLDLKNQLEEKKTTGQENARNILNDSKLSKKDLSNEVRNSNLNYTKQGLTNKKIAEQLLGAWGLEIKSSEKDLHSIQSNLGEYGRTIEYFQSLQEKLLSPDKITTKQQAESQLKTIQHMQDAYNQMFKLEGSFKTSLQSSDGSDFKLGIEQLGIKNPKEVIGSYINAYVKTFTSSLENQFNKAQTDFSATISKRAAQQKSAAEKGEKRALQREESRRERGRPSKSFEGGTGGTSGTGQVLNNQDLENAEREFNNTATQTEGVVTEEAIENVNQYISSLDSCISKIKELMTVYDEQGGDLSDQEWAELGKYYEGINRIAKDEGISEKELKNKMSSAKIPSQLIDDFFFYATPEGIEDIIEDESVLKNFQKEIKSIQTSKRLDTNELQSKVDQIASLIDESFNYEPDTKEYTENLEKQARLYGEIKEKFGEAIKDPMLDIKSEEDIKELESVLARLESQKEKSKSVQNSNQNQTYDEKEHGNNQEYYDNNRSTEEYFDETSMGDFDEKGLNNLKAIFSQISSLISNINETISSTGDIDISSSMEQLKKSVLDFQDIFTTIGNMPSPENFDSLISTIKQIIQAISDLSTSYGGNQFASAMKNWEEADEILREFRRGSGSMGLTTNVEEFGPLERAALVDSLTGKISNTHAIGHDGFTEQKTIRRLQKGKSYDTFLHSHPAFGQTIADDTSGTWYKGKGADLAFSHADISLYRDFLKEGFVKKMMAESKGMIRELDLSSLDKDSLDKIADTFLAPSKNFDGVITRFDEYMMEEKDKLVSSLYDSKTKTYDYDLQSKIATDFLMQAIKEHGTINGEKITDPTQFLKDYSVDSLQIDQNVLEQNKQNILSSIANVNEIMTGLSSVLGETTISQGSEVDTASIIQGYLEKYQNTFQAINNMMSSIATMSSESSSINTEELIASITNLGECLKSITTSITNIIPTNGEMPDFANSDYLSQFTSFITDIENFINQVTSVFSGNSVLASNEEGTSLDFSEKFTDVFNTIEKINSIKTSMSQMLQQEEISTDFEVEDYLGKIDYFKNMFIQISNLLTEVSSLFAENNFENISGLEDISSITGIFNNLSVLFQSLSSIQSEPDTIAGLESYVNQCQNVFKAINNTIDKITLIGIGVDTGSVGNYAQNLDSMMSNLNNTIQNVEYILAQMANNEDDIYYFDNSYFEGLITVLNRVSDFIHDVKTIFGTLGAASDTQTAEFQGLETSITQITQYIQQIGEINNLMASLTPQESTDTFTPESNLTILAEKLTAINTFFSQLNAFFVAISTSISSLNTADISSLSVQLSSSIESIKNIISAINKINEINIESFNQNLSAFKENQSFNVSSQEKATTEEIDEKDFTKISNETTEMDSLEQAVDSVTAAVDRKTRAFEEEGQVVQGVIQSESNSIETLTGWINMLVEELEKMGQISEKIMGNTDLHRLMSNGISDSNNTGFNNVDNTPTKDDLNSGKKSSWDEYSKNAYALKRDAEKYSNNIKKWFLGQKFDSTFISETSKQIQEAQDSFSKALSSDNPPGQRWENGYNAFINEFKQKGIELGKTLSGSFDNTILDLNPDSKNLVHLEEYVSKFDDLKAKVAELKSLFKEDDFLLNGDKLRQAYDLSSSINKQSDYLKGDNFIPIDELTRSKYQARVEKWGRKNSAALRDENLKQRFDDITTKLSSSELSKADLSPIIQQFNELDAVTSKTGKNGLSFFDMWKGRIQNLGTYLLSYVSLFRVWNTFKQGVSIVRELNTALTEMRKVSDESMTSLKNYQFESFDIADKIGSTGQQIQNSTADWMRLGESMTEASHSAETSNVLLNVSEFQSIDEATTSLVSMSQAYKNLDKMDIVDKLNNIGNNYSISTDQIATALQNSAASLVTAHNDIDESIALITAGNAITQDASKTGAGLRTIALRIQGTEEAKEELESLGEDTDDYVVATKSKIDQQVKDFTAVASNGFKGISVLDENGNYRSTYQILQDIADVYDEIKETDKQYGTNHEQGLLELLAGKTRSNIAASILQNGDLLRSVYESSQNSKGSALEENEKYLDSVDGKIQQLQNRLQELAFTLLDDDLLKGAISGLTTILELINNIASAIGGLPVLLAGLFSGRVALDNIKNGTKGKLRDFLGLKDDTITEDSSSSTKTNIPNAGSNKPTSANVSNEINNETDSIIEENNAIVEQNEELQKNKELKEENTNLIDENRQIDEHKRSLESEEELYFQNESKPRESRPETKIEDLQKERQQKLKDKQEKAYQKKKQQNDIESTKAQKEVENNITKEAQARQEDYINGYVNEVEESTLDLYDDLYAESQEELEKNLEKTLDYHNQTDLESWKNNRKAEAEAMDEAFLSRYDDNFDTYMENLPDPKESENRTNALKQADEARNRIKTETEAQLDDYLGSYIDEAEETTLDLYDELYSEPPIEPKSGEKALADAEAKGRQRAYMQPYTKPEITPEVATPNIGEEIIENTTAVAEGIEEVATEATEAQAPIQGLFSGISEGALNLGGSVLGKLGAFASTIGSMIPQIAAMMIATTIISKITQAISDWVREEELTVQAGEEAQQNIKESVSSYEQLNSSLQNLGQTYSDNDSKISSSSDAISTLAEKYTELKEGVNSVTNENISLSDSDYQAYLDISNQLAQAMPSLQSGTDNAGNAILNLGNNASDAKDKLQELYNVQQQITHGDISQNLQDVYKGMVAEISGSKNGIDKQINDLRKRNQDILKGQSITDKKLRDSKGIQTSLNFGQENNKQLVSRFKEIIGNAYEEVNPNDIMGLGARAAKSNSLFYDGTYNQVKVDTDKLLRYLENNKEVFNKAQEQMNAEIAKFVEKNNTEVANNNNQIAALTTQREAQWKEIVPTVQSFLKTESNFSDFDKTLQEGIINNLGNMNVDSVMDKVRDSYGGDLEFYLYGEFITPLKNTSKEQQKALSDLLSLDTKELNYNQYSKSVSDALQKIFPDDVEMQNEWRSKLGIDSMLQQYSNQIKALSTRVSGLAREDLFQLSQEELNLAVQMTLEDGPFNGTLAELKTKIEEFKQTAQEPVPVTIQEFIKQEDSGFQKIQKATESANAGATYDSFVQNLKTAKELVESGDIGTDDFKAIAGMFSPSGSDDYANWVENLPNIEKYFTEGTEGVTNFMEKLEELNYAKFDEEGNFSFMNNTTHDLEDIAGQMGISYEAFLSLWGELEDKGIATDFYSSLEDGESKLNNLSTERLKTQLELNKIEKEYGTDSQVYKSKQETLDSLNDRYKNLKQSLLEYKELEEKKSKKTPEEIKKEQKEQAENRKDIKKAGVDFNQDLQKNEERYRTDPVYKQMMDDQADIIIQMARENGLTETDRTINGEIYQDPKAANKQQLDEIIKAVEEGKTDEETRTKLDQLANYADSQGKTIESVLAEHGFDPSKYTELQEYAKEHGIELTESIGTTIDTAAKGFATEVEAAGHAFYNAIMGEEPPTDKNSKKTQAEKEKKEKKEKEEKEEKEKKEEKIKTRDPEVRKKQLAEKITKEGKTNLNPTHGALKINRFRPLTEEERQRKKGTKLPPINNNPTEPQFAPKNGTFRPGNRWLGNKEDYTGYKASAKDKMWNGFVKSVNFLGELFSGGRPITSNGTPIPSTEEKDLPTAKVPIEYDQETAEESLESVNEEASESTDPVKVTAEVEKVDTSSAQQAIASASASLSDGLSQGLTARPTIETPTQHVTQEVETDGNVTEVDDTTQTVHQVAEPEEQITNPEDATQDVNQTVISPIPTVLEPAVQPVEQKPVEGGEGKAKDIQQNVERKVDNSQANQVPKPVQQIVNRKPNNSAVMSNPPSVNQNVNRVVSNPGNVNSDLPPIHQKIIRTIEPKGAYTGTAYPSGGKKLDLGINGKSYLFGTAYAGGSKSSVRNIDLNNLPSSWQTRRPNYALTGELGPEILVNAKTNSWQLLGEHGAEFNYIPRDSIIFNAEQTEELLSNGATESRGSALIGGTAYARPSGSAGGRPIIGRKSSSSSSSSSSGKSSGKSKRKSSGGGGNDSGSGKKSSKKDKSDKGSSKLEKYLENIFDWAEYRLKNLSAMADKYSKLADSAQVWSKQIETATQTINGVNVNYTVGGASQLYDQALHTLNEQIAGTQKSIQGYQAFYNKAVKLSGLDSATIQKIQNLTSAGQFDVQVFGGSGKSNGKNSKSSSKNKKLTAIENVSKWYQKVLDTQNSIEDLILQRAELAQKKLDAVEDIYNAQASVYENTAKRDQARMEHILNATGISYGYFSSARSSISSAMDAVNAARETYNQFSEEFNRQVAQGYLVEGTKSYNENLAKRLELETKIYEAINDAQEQVAETFENIADHYENLRERNEERLDVNEGNIDITKRNQRGYTSRQLRNLYGERNNLQYNNLQLAAEELYSQQANKQLLISSRPNDLTALRAADEAIEAAQNKWSQALVDYRQYLYDAKDENIDNIEDYFGALEDYFDSVQDAVDAGIDWKNTVGKVVTERDYRDSIDAVGKAVDNARQKYNAMFAELKDQIEKGYITVGSQKWYESLAKINSIQNDVLKAETARKDLYNQISQIRLDNIQAAIDSFTNLNDTLSDFADLLNDMGNKRQVLGKVDEPYLRRQMGISEQTIYGYDRQRTELLKQMGGVEKYSERWNDLNDQLQDVNSNIIQAAQNMEEFADAIREVRWDKFNKGIETIDYTKTELSDLIDILNEENFTNKNGTVTLEGLSAIALYGKQIEQNVEEVQAYRTALEKLQEEYDNNVISQDEYTETSREYMDAIRDSTSAIQDLRDAMTDLYFDALEKENDLLQENISKREESLQKTKDYYNYTKTIKNDTKDIKYLQSQIAALNGVNSLSAQGKLSSLRSQLADATEQYNDDRQNHYFDLMSQGYDKMSEDANKALEDIEDAVKRSTEKQTQIIREMLNTAGNEYKNVYQRINQIINENGIVLSNNTQNTINKLRTEKTSISDIGLTYSLITSQMVAESEAITGANGIVTTAINELGMVGNKLNDIVTSASGVKTSFSDIGTEIDKIQNSFDKATDSIVTAASTALSQIKNLADEVQAQIDKAQAAANAKIASATKAPTTTASGTASSQASASSSSSSQNTQVSQAQATKQSAIAFAVDYIIKNSSKFPAKAINATGDKLIMGVAKLNGNKTIRPNQVADLKNRIKAMLGVDYSSDAIFYAIQSQLKAMINGRTATGMVAYAKGSEHINRKQNAITNESGWEAIYRKSDGAILTPLNVGDKVFTNEMSENLWKLAQGNTLGTEMMSKTASPIINNVETYKPNITVSFENFMTVQGNVDKDVLGDLKNLKNEWMTDFSKHLTKEFGLLGNKRRFS